MAKENEKPNVYTRLSLGFMSWLGGAVYIAHQPGCDFWDGMVWMYYVGRYIAHNFAMIGH